jgi:hypothetical protein
VIDFPALTKALNKINYKGFCSIEFEKDMKDPLPGLPNLLVFQRCYENNGSIIKIFIVRMMKFIQRLLAVCIACILFVFMHAITATIQPQKMIH